MASEGTVGEDYIVAFTVFTGSGAPEPGVTLAELVARVRNLDTAVDDGSVATTVEIGNGRYSFIIRGVFTTAEGVGNYGWSVERTTTGLTHVISDTVRFLLRDSDDLAQPGDAMDLVIDAVDADAMATSGVNEIRDSILSDSTPFDGADIAAILLDTSTTLPGEHAVIQADTDDIQTRLPAALVGGRMDADVGNMQAGTVDAAAIATDAIDADALATDGLQEIADHLETNGTNPHGTGAWDATATATDWTSAERDQIRFRLSMDGSQTDPTTGVGTIESILSDTDSLDTTKITTARADNLDEITAIRLAELDAANLPADIDAILVDTNTTIPGLIAALNDLSASEAADAVWDELVAGHSIADSFADQIIRGFSDVVVSPTFNLGSNTLFIDVHLERLREQIAAGLVSATVVVRNAGGVIATLATPADGSFDAAGVAHLSQVVTAIGSLTGVSIQMIATVVDGTGSVTDTHHAQIP